MKKIAFVLGVLILSASIPPVFAEGFHEYNKTQDGTIIVSDGGDSLTVDGTVSATATISGTVTTTNGATSLGDNRKTVTAGSAEAIASSTACKTVFITALLSNTGVVVVGGSTVVAAVLTRRGIPLQAGDSIVIKTDNLADIYIDSMTTGEGVSFTYTV